MRKNSNLISYLCLFSLFVFGIILLASSVSAREANVCCEKTISGEFCQNVKAEECAPDALQVPTSCDTASFCQPGVCYDSSEGTCLDNTPQLVCNMKNATWSESFPAQCELGCCVLGDQAAFVSLVRCKKLSSYLGLQTNYNKGIKDESACIISVKNQDKGACVFESEFEKTCKFTTREECDSGVGGKKGAFYKDKLCSAEELGTNCGLSTKTACVPGKDEVYFLDTCGNPANIYDSSKVNDKTYWANVKDKGESCGAGIGNANSKSCGNCDYLQGSYCRASEITKTRASYGDFICADLNCKKTSNGKSYKHGESWCVFKDAGGIEDGKASVGSRFYKHICINGEEVLEQCADFRNEECVENKVSGVSASFSQAACRVNRWRDCTAQTDKADCDNTDRRDCFWKEDVLFAPTAAASANKTNTGDEDEEEVKNKTNGACLPKIPPGLQFWQGEETKAICSQANVACVVTYEEGLLGGKECVKNCQCLDKSWEQNQADVCRALGDCGPGTNWIGVSGYREGFKKFLEKVKEAED